MRTTFWSRAGRLWCTMMHGKSMWPMRGYYRCATCLRTYPVRWAHHEGSPASQRRVLPGVAAAASEIGSFAVAPAAFAGQKAKLAETAQPWA